MVRKVYQKLDFILFGYLINYLYPEYYRPKYGYIKYSTLFFKFYIPQKIFRLNPKVRWPVHFTSKVVAPEKITKGVMCDPGDNFGNYIQATNGIFFGSNIEIGPGTHIISSNHDFNDFFKQTKAKPIIIGDSVWIGANCVILPEVEIGSNVIIGAGSVVAKKIPANSIAIGNPCKVIKSKEPNTKDFSNFIFNKKIPKEYNKFINQVIKKSSNK